MSCVHNERIFDGGFEVCIGCGISTSSLVLERIDLHFKSPKTDESSEDRIHDKNCEILIDCVCNANLPTKYANMAYEYFLRIFEEGSKTSQDRVVKAKLFACLYQVLLENHVSFTYRELAAFTELSAENISQAHKQYFFENLTSTNEIMQPSDICFRLCTKSGLSRKDSAKILKNILEVQENECLTSNPATIVCAFIYAYCLKNNIKITLKLLSETSGISTSAIRRYYNLKLISS